MKNNVLLLILTMLLVVACSISFASTPEPTLMPTPTQEPCLAGGNQADINAHLKTSGSEAVLCQGSVFELTGSVIMNSPNQKIYTEGYPQDDRRAILRITSSYVTTAIKMRDNDD